MIELKPLLRINAKVGEPQVTPQGPTGDRRFIPVTGGTFEGERLRGEMLAGGSDCQLIRADGVADLDVRVALRCDDGAVIFMKGLGMRHGPTAVMQRLAAGEDVDPSEYYFREAVLFEAPPGPHEWLNRVLAVGTGRRDPDAVTVANSPGVGTDIRFPPSTRHCGPAKVPSADNRLFRGSANRAPYGDRPPGTSSGGHPPQHPS